MTSSLSAAKIGQFLDINCCFKPGHLLVFNEIDSTNSYLLNKLANHPKCSPYICTADYQTAGRGRLNRKWITSISKSIAVSFSYHFPTLDSRLIPQLAIVVATIVAEVVTSLGIKIEIKWPNDLYAHKRKLAGILIETFAVTPQSFSVIIGIGINYELPELNAIDQPITALAEQLPLSSLPPREQIIASLANQLSKALPIFMLNGIKSFYPRWQYYDMLLGRKITAYLPNNQIIFGTGNGLKHDGSYQLILKNNHPMDLSLGEVSVRLTQSG